jgi:uroporphyrinogen-III decarboxylase
MKSRDRVKATISLEHPDRAPIMHSPLPGALIKYGERLNDIFVRYPQDFGPSRFEIPELEDLPPNYKKGVHKDEWGTVWISSINGVHGQVYDYPIKSWDDLKNYELPPLQETTSSYQIQDLRKTKARVSKLKDEGYFTILGFSPGNFYERMQWLRGFENLLVDFVRNLRQVHELADMLLEYCLRSIEFVLDAKPDAVSLADDWGTQDRLMVKPEFWREFFKPRYKEMFNLIHDGGAYVYFHSDGYILDIIPDLIEIGVDILNPQYSCFKLEELAQAVHGKLCIASDIDRQYVLPRGSIKEVDEYVKKVVELFSHCGRGGLICRGEVGVDVPLENVEAMYMAFKKRGKYR